MLGVPCLSPNMGTQPDSVKYGKPEGAQKCKTALYRHFDADGQLLYVGISRSLCARDKQHNAASDWFQEVTRTETEWFPRRLDAQRAEIRAILQEKPVFNDMGKPSSSSAVADRVTSVRRYAGLTQQDFARVLGVSRTCYSNWENDIQQVSLQGALRLNELFNVSLDWLYLGTGAPPYDDERAAVGASQ